MGPAQADEEGGGTVGGADPAERSRTLPKLPAAIPWPPREVPPLPPMPAPIAQPTTELNRAAAPACVAAWSRSMPRAAISSVVATGDRTS